MDSSSYYLSRLVDSLDSISRSLEGIENHLNRSNVLDDIKSLLHDLVDTLSADAIVNIYREAGKDIQELLSARGEEG